MAYIGNVPAEKYTALTQQTFSSPTGTSFTLSQAVTNSVDIDLYIDNVKQDPTTYSVSGTALTTSTIASPSTMYCIYNGRTTETVNPPDDSVGLAQLAGGTDGNIISYDASGNPVAVATGTDGQVLTSAGAGQPCAFETLTTGKVIQVVNTQSSAVVTGTTVMVQDNTIPQSNEGVEYTSIATAITPTNSSNKLLIIVDVFSAHTVGSRTIYGLFQDSTANAIKATAEYDGTSNAERHVMFSFFMTAGTTSATTFKLRAMSDSGATITFGGVSGGALYGGVAFSSMTIMEIAV